MKTLTLFFLTSILAILYACEEVTPVELAPVASFTVPSTDGTAGVPMDFDNTSKNAIRYEWDFGDGSKSELEFPTHTYTESGIYLARLTAYDKDGQSAGHSISFRIGHRYINRFWLNSSKTTLPINMVLYFEEVGKPENSYAFSFVTGIKKDDLPAGGSLPSGDFIKLSNKNWVWTIYANNDPLDVLDGRDQIFLLLTTILCLIFCNIFAQYN